MIIIGVDPGPCTGICVLRYPGEPSFYQCDNMTAQGLVRELLRGRSRPEQGALLVGEAFQAGRGAGARQASGAVTRAVIQELSSLGKWHWRAAGLVKPWATDERLKKAGLWMNGMPHAMDAARHALYCAVHDGGMPDPLSRKGES